MNGLASEGKMLAALHTIITAVKKHTMGLRRRRLLSELATSCTGASHGVNLGVPALSFPFLSVQPRSRLRSLELASFS